MLELSVFFPGCEPKAESAHTEVTTRTLPTAMHGNILISKLVPTHLAWVALQFAASACFAVHEKQKHRDHILYFSLGNRQHIVSEHASFFPSLSVILLFHKVIQPLFQPLRTNSIFTV